MSRQLWRPVVLVAVAVALTVSCGWAAAIHGADVSAEEVEGRWDNGAGASLTLHEDHTFTSERFGELPIASECGNPRALASGRWAFYASVEADEAAVRGSVLSLKFSPDDCDVVAHLFGDGDDLVMCATEDPDNGCSDGGSFHRTRTEVSGSRDGGQGARAAAVGT
ncbi:hypothetical protein C5F59_028120 [Streptomyces sp. QL37]|uniref:hypothetical protein n=1 Tax=Streptomyces sp. QL37 TaxID=2093747 RepID=UPI000CF24389|nr:hypothetical protein [Streptomyces sp. QL37]PPQ57028.1 hypothetical protein C5F59_10325 [Streptomyces sp. QL37]